MLRIRSKISFSAFIKGMTIPELIYNAIIKIFDNERANSWYNDSVGDIASDANREK